MPLADGLWKVRSVSYVGAVRARWVFSTKFVVELHDLPHQPFDQVLAKNAILARGQFGHGLRDGLNHFIRFAVSTSSGPVGANAYWAKKSSIGSTFVQRR